VGTRCADHVTPLYPQKLELTSPTGGGRSVGIVRSRTKATEFFYIYIYMCVCVCVCVCNISSLRVNTSVHCSGRKQVKG
jgi:hypothetical protein